MIEENSAPVSGPLSSLSDFRSPFSGLKTSPVPRPQFLRDSVAGGSDFPPDWLSPEAPPLVLDVGCHRGSFLLELAPFEPQHNILGIEKLPLRVTRTRKKIERLGLTNAWAVQGGGLESLQTLPDASISVIHVLFPDPWPKRRHGDRRLVKPAFLAECLRVLKPGGLLRFVTDDEPYALEVANFSFQFPALTRTELALDAYPPSGFELTFRELGKPVHRFAWIKS